MIVTQIKDRHPKLYVTETRNNDMKFQAENDTGFVEYKRTLTECSASRAERYATQMNWRISENQKNQIAIYYIGIDDDGTVVGLNQQEIFDCIDRFVTIANSISASIIGVHIIHVHDLSILKIAVKKKKIQDSFLVEFGEKF